MAVEHHIKIDGIVGESVSKDHKGEVQVLSWTWGLSSDGGAPGPGGGAGTSKANAQDFTFVHTYDKASPKLAAAAAAGKHIKQAVLSARRSGEGQKDFLVVTMKEVVVTSVQQSASEEGISENVSLRAAQVTFEYRAMDTKGALGDPTTFDWNISKNIVK